MLITLPKPRRLFERRADFAGTRAALVSTPLEGKTQMHSKRPARTGQTPAATPARAEFERQARGILAYSNIGVDFITHTIVDALTDACRHAEVPELMHDEPHEDQVQAVADLLAKLPPTFNLRDVRAERTGQTGATAVDESGRAEVAVWLSAILAHPESVPTPFYNALADACSALQNCLDANSPAFIRAMLELYERPEARRDQGGAR